MDDIQKIYQKLEEQEKRINNIEKSINIKPLVNQNIEETQEKNINITTSNNFNEIAKNKKSNISKPIMPKFSFIQVLTFLGVLGVVIGLLSFYFYAVANNWIGEGLQILIGVCVGAGLFSLAYSLYEKNEMWSMFVFGGSLLTEFISIGVGVLEYEVLPEILGLFILLIFIAISIMLSIKFNSRVIAYYAIAGGYLVPFLTGLYESKLFVLSYLLILAISLLFLSSKYNWADLRFASFLIQLIYILSSMNLLGRDEYLTMALTFIILNFLIYNIATLIFAIKNAKPLNQLDIVTMNFNSLFFLIFSNNILNDILTTIEFGIYMLPMAFIYLFEIYYLKQSSKTDFKELYYSILSSAIVTLNLSIYFILNIVNIDFFIMLFAIEWVLFSIISNNSKDSKFYKSVSYVFLGFFIFWYLFIVRFGEGILHGTLYMLFFITMVPIIVFLVKKKIDVKINGPFLFIYIFAIIYSFAKYLGFLKFNNIMMSLLVSIMWLIYTLVGIKIFAKHKDAKLLLMVLLGITLVKIAFVDLFYLNGVYRIIGFTVFGILLLIGGYFLKNETETETESEITNKTENKTTNEIESRTNNKNEQENNNKNGERNEK